jgi:aryl-alcohol dehydrogenase-like predicted oxidoreductase
MKYIQLGKRGPEVSTISFGAWAIGGLNWGKTDDEVSVKALHEAIDRGVNLIDTADVYGFGHSEELISRILRERGRDQVIVASKAGNDFYNATDKDDHGYGPIKQTYTFDYLVGAVEKSLKRLKVDTLDILQLHSPNLERLEEEEPWRALEQLKRDGKIKHAGWSVQSFQESEQAHILDRHHDLLDCIQVRYNLLERKAEQLLFPKAMQYGIGVIVRIPILFGLLSGKFNEQSTFSEDDHRHMNLSEEKLKNYLDQLKRYKPLFERFPDQSMTQLSLRFCISHPACQTAIPGAKTALQVEENCASSDLGPIPQELLEQFPAELDRERG